MQAIKTTENVVSVVLDGGLTARITFLEPGIFRYDVDPAGLYAEYAQPRDAAHTARIQQYPDTSDHYAKPQAKAWEKEGKVTVTNGSISVTFDNKTGCMQVRNQKKTVLEEAAPLAVAEAATVQTLVKREGEEFFGGGTQNGRFVHTGTSINIVNESMWMDGGVASPNPFYYSSGGYGVLRNTFSDGCYDFGKSDEKKVTAEHKEGRFSAYYFISDGENTRQVVLDILRGYFKVTGNPLLLPEYGFYQGHLNCYNRDAWSDESGTKEWNVKGTEPADSPGTSRYESGMATGYRLTEGLHSESLNGERPTYAIENYPESVDTPYEFSARAVVDDYLKYDMPLGYFLPNDGYGGGYGQNGYYKQGGVAEDGSSSKERIGAVDANIENLTRFTEYVNEKGIAAGLWTESNLAPDSDQNTFWHLLRDFRKEVNVGGVTTLKTDVAWVGPGYSFQLNGVKTAYDIVTTSRNFRPNIISLDGWAGSQRFNSVWSGDQTGGNWEYIRFHIPTYIGSSLGGNPNIGSDMDGIFGGKALICTRDFQWKSFTPQMLNMDGWGSYMKSPYTFGDPYTGINRMYLKMKAQLMPYIYTTAVAASNIETGNGDRGLPMVRAMFLEYPGEAFAYSKRTQYQFLLGGDILVAPIYQNTAADAEGNDIRNDIYLPDENQVWVDYLTGEQYQGGRVLNYFEAPLWKLPVFVKNGAILPMYEENNTPDQIDRTKRIVEFWAAGESSYTVYEDDGKYISNQTREEEGYGVIDEISYGSHVSTTYTSKVQDHTAILTAQVSEGSYNGYQPQRNTTFVVHVSRKPESVTARNGEQVLRMAEAASKDEFEKAVPAAGEAIFFYEQSPSIKTYASGAEKRIAALVADVRTAPKLYVKLATVDAQKEEQSVTITGFENQARMLPDQMNPALDAPVLTVAEEEKTPTKIVLNWNAVEGAQAYEMLIDGQLNIIGSHLSYANEDLAYHSAHRYQIRSRNEEGYSAWSQETIAESLLDPWRNEIGARGTITWTGGDEAGELKYATDHSIRGMFFSTSDVVAERLPFIYDFGAVYELERFEYYPRDSYGSGTVQRMNVSSSLDGVHWKLEWDGEREPEWEYDAELELEQNKKIVPLDKVSARFVKLEVIKSKRNWFAAHELPVFKKDGTKAFAVGSTNKNETVSEGDYTNMKNYLGTSVKDGANFTDQIEKRCGDINRNGVYDVYDYAYTMFKLDGGTKQTGAVSGKISLVPDGDVVKAGEVFCLKVVSDTVENLNAFGKVLHYDPVRMEFVTVQQESCISQMEDLTVNKVYSDGTAYVNLAFANRGDKVLYSGSGRLATIQMRALADIRPADELELTNVMLIGPEFDVSAE